MKLWREVTRTPGRAALATLDLCAMAGFLISLRTIPVTTLDAQGPLRARCGLTFYVSSASNRAVDSACRYAFATRVPQLLLFALLAIAATACLVIAIARPESDERRGGRQLWRDVTRTPARAALATFDVAALDKSVEYFGHHLEFNQSAAERSVDALREFLYATLGGSERAKEPTK